MPIVSLSSCAGSCNGFLAAWIGCAYSLSITHKHLAVTLQAAVEVGRQQQGSSVKSMSNSAPSCQHSNTVSGGRSAGSLRSWQTAAGPQRQIHVKFSSLMSTLKHSIWRKLCRQPQKLADSSSPP